MTMYELSICIPAREEEFLPQTVEDLLAHTSDKTEVIVGLDGYEIELPAHPRLRVHKEPESIGQRAMQNRLVEMSTAKYVAKTDAHCAFDDDFDTKMLARMEDDITMVAVMRNLHIFDWLCDFCEWRGYQGPKPDICPECQSDASHIDKQIVWNPKTNPQSSAYRFNKNLQFKYFPELRNKLPKEGLQESMSLQGSFFMCTREKYWSLKLCDESWGSWGNQGSEVAIKTWLSGGRVMCNFDTWYGHLFRTQSGFSFPYPMSGTSQERARKISRDLFLTNSWEHQIRPLSWIIERFWFALVDVRDKEAFWGNRALRELKKSEEGLSFPAKGSLPPNSDPLIPGDGTHLPSILGSGSSHTDDAQPSTSLLTGDEMSSNTMGLPAVDRPDGISPVEILGIENELEVVGINTAGIITNDMVEDGDITPSASRNRPNQPGPSESVGQLDSPQVPKVPVTDSILRASPDPTVAVRVNDNLREKSISNNRTILDNQHKRIIPQRELIYYTAHQKPLKIAGACQKKLRQISAQKDIPIRSVTLKPMDKMGENICLPLEPGKLTYFMQIITALRTSTADIVYMTEDDVLYHESHFDYIPEDDLFHFDVNWWKIRVSDGFAASWEAAQVSGLVARREPLLAWYRDKLDNIMKKGFDRRYEPGGRHDEQRVMWKAAAPHIDIRVGGAMTASKWSLDDFRDKSSAINFQTSTIENIPNWGYDELRKLIEN